MCVDDVNCALAGAQLQLSSSELLNQGFELRPRLCRIQPDNALTGSHALAISGLGDITGLQRLDNLALPSSGSVTAPR
ncbi:hypothetical protein C7I87_34435 [Mesorhizobium sp. SARCC-RB16n]|uniref:hypothetical protein n=1 Tax=Mesorhizobium sp. SARCC-RB16n TaxID=2116687 RepID=UPI00122F604E|nr:hypothetical protein [Mesorhizobium sp. SARCC-RB16n]KAA3441660.1 hypothetical protein C7I87_34435 [Mesorhizobium sp. SARCC-RB16n]